MQYKAVLIGSIKRGERRERTEKIQKAAERSYAGVCASGLARNPAPARLWIFVRFVHFVRRVLGSAERSDAACIKTSTRLGAKWLTLEEKYGIVYVLF